MWLTPKRSQTFQLIKSTCLRKISFGMKWKQDLGNAAWPKQPHILDFSSPLHILHGEASEPAGSLLESPPWPRVSPPSLLKPSAKGPASGRTLKLLLIPFGSVAKHQNAPANTSAIIANVKQLPGAPWGRQTAPTPPPAPPPAAGSAVRHGRSAWLCRE